MRAGALVEANRILNVARLLEAARVLVAHCEGVVGGGWQVKNNDEGWVRIAVFTNKFVWFTR